MVRIGWGDCSGSRMVAVRRGCLLLLLLVLVLAVVVVVLV